MGFSTLLKSTKFALKMFRLYWSFLVVVLLFPVTYMVVVVAMMQGSPEALKVALTGYVIIAGFSVLFSMPATLVTEMFEEQVLETLALLPVPFWEIMVSQLLALALVGVASLSVGLVGLWCVSGGVDLALLLVGLALVFVLYIPLAVLVGITVKSRIKLQSLISILSFLVVIATPAFYRLAYIGEPYRTLLLVNPLAHVAVVLRAAVGIPEGVPETVSVAYVALTSLALSAAIWYKLRGGVFTVVERR